ncbi:MAG: translation elongation factor Ts [Candidatus Vogelbacteria bacterium RIFOXYD1_FULL_44_32]|uniref:Elongation factor Ts n=1 Tax=Candidatus Vogelbacteria bacterium RIFOXYD1_FULL_44_32 TaxID=1802438 RepID=A0A1G2QE50_9BACT|nr:MAG: translation elongation factor Ts [Candidatus Vogelbacteria bacterium RIFOXYD1_FULL_44_32]
MADTQSIKVLRDQTGISLAECKKALDEAGGDLAKAQVVLKAKGAETADKKSDRNLGSGVVECYIHGAGAIGAMVELACETDFVAKNVDFKALASDIALHIVASAPETVAELLAQEFVKDPSQTVETLIQQGTQKFGERIVLTRFARFALGA